ncbi:MAG: sigma-70 family RNA polymerase sigma factor [Casimicrobiaceae bacterium]|jgi:RNA polymerase sigma factor (sigma-70 family)
MANADTDRSAHLADLLARTALADQGAYAELYRLTAPHLYGVALRILREPALAEDLLQEAFVSIWHHAGTYTAAKAKPQTWLASVVRNRCLDQLRRREPDTMTMTRDEDETEMDFEALGPTPEELLLSGADAHSVRTCVEGLEGAQKQAIALAFVRGMSHAELALHLHQPLGTVKAWVRRGLERLRKCLEAAGFVP